MDRLREGNALKFAVFGLNVSHGCAVTKAPGNIEVDWAESLRIARAADAAGIEALIPVARWKGFGGETQFNHRSFETYTWAAGLAQATNHIHVLATSHVPTMHPVMAAKQGATIDHISGGRFGLNIVAGWNASEIGMFGRPQREHDERYAVAGEWIEIIKRLWSEPGLFDFKGKYFDCPQAYAEPKPLQQPNPFIVSAGVSPAGQRFAAEHADMNFMLAPNLEVGAEIVRSVKAIAREEFGREIQVWGMAAITQGETQAEAQEYFDYYVDEVGDWTGAENMLNAFAPNSGSFSPKHRAEHLRAMVAGYCAFPIVGTAERIADQLIEMSTLGFDGLSLSWVNYDTGIASFATEVMPLLEQAGVRNTFVPAAADSAA